MTPDELSRIREIYEQAVALNGPEREPYLAAECADDAKLRDQVELLVHAHANIPT